MLLVPFAAVVAAGVAIDIVGVGVVAAVVLMVDVGVVVGVVAIVIYLLVCWGCLVGSRSCCTVPQPRTHFLTLVMTTHPLPFSPPRQSRRGPWQ